MTTMSPGRSELAAFILRYIEDHDISVREASRRWGMPHATLVKILNNPERVPDLHTLKKVAEGTGEALSKLITLCGFALGDTPISEGALVGLTDEQITWWLSIPPSRRADLLEALQRLYGGREDRA
jgi:hypothetical protein